MAREVKVKLRKSQCQSFGGAWADADCHQLSQVPRKRAATLEQVSGALTRPQRNEDLQELRVTWDALVISHCAI